MFNLRLCNAATIRYSLLKFGHMHLCGKDYKCFSPHCCKCNSFGCIAAIRCVNACHGPHSDSVYSGSEHRQFNSPRLVKREASFPNPRRALIGSNQLWRVNDSPYYRELFIYPTSLKHLNSLRGIMIPLQWNSKLAVSFCGNLVMQLLDYKIPGTQRKWNHCIVLNTFHLIPHFRVIDFRIFRMLWSVSAPTELYVA